jgi:anti-sigma factor RsiW
MDHRYIDEHSVAGRYLDHELTPEERAEFETHLVDCQECTDRVLLAEMFHCRNGAKKFGSARQGKGPEAPEAPMRVRFVSLLSPWQLFLILAAAALLLVLMPSLFLLWVGR